VGYLWELLILSVILSKVDVREADVNAAEGPLSLELNHGPLREFSPGAEDIVRIPIRVHLGVG
jgi:hypothetical protein